jgi:ABC-type transport system substrate-binding protein
VFFHSSGGSLNWSNLVDERMDEAFELGRVSQSAEDRKEAYATVQEVLAEQVPILWIDHLGDIEGVVATPELHGILGQTTLHGDDSWGFTGGSFFGWGQVWKG